MHINRRHSFNSAQEPVRWLRSWLEQHKSVYRVFRLRAVLVRHDDRLRLYSCAIQPFTESGECEAGREKSRNYEAAILVEKWLDAACVVDLFERDFNIERDLEGEMLLGDYNVAVNETSYRSSQERVFFENYYMSRAGQVLSREIEKNTYADSGPLPHFRHPYYPSLEAATRAWMPFYRYMSGYGNMHGAIVCLFPETRAYLEAVEPVEGGVKLMLGGDLNGSKELCVTGAWWGDDGHVSFSEPVQEGVVQIGIPKSVSRLDYVLLDDAGEIYDGSVNAHGSIDFYEEGDTKQLIEALRQGEGKSIEFKPYVELKNDKFQEIIRTSIAFANTDGGHIFIGVEDDCVVEGVGKALIDKKTGHIDEGEKKYIGDIKKHLRDKVAGDFNLDIYGISYKDRRVIAMSIGKRHDESYPCYLMHEKLVYVRRGSSSAKADPELDLPRLCGNNPFSIQGFKESGDVF